MNKMAYTDTVYKDTRRVLYCSPALLLVDVLCCRRNTYVMYDKYGIPPSLRTRSVGFAVARESSALEGDGNALPSSCWTGCSGLEHKQCTPT